MRITTILYGLYHVIVVAGTSSSSSSLSSSSSSNIVATSKATDDSHNKNENEHERGNGNHPDPEGQLQSRRVSSDWWERLYEGGYEQGDGGNPIDEEANVESSRPLNRRSHSAAIYRRYNNYSNNHNNNNNNKSNDDNNNNNNSNNDEEMTEWMIVSGGFTDDDWNTFPVWAYDVTHARNEKDAFASEGVSSETGPSWIDLTGLRLGGAPSSSSSSSFSSSSRPLPGPEGRVGHLTSVYDGCLYVFGGLTYSQGSFHAEYEADGGVLGTMIVWKACHLEESFQRGEDADDENRGDNHDGSDGKLRLRWERIVPKVNSNLPDPTSGTSVDDHREFGKHREPEHSPSPSQSQSQSTERPDYARRLPRGEAQGGHYPASDDHRRRDSFVFYGGMHHDHIVEDARAGAAGAEYPLGDVWKYEYQTETLTLLAPYPPLVWQRDERNGGYPIARTAHAGTIVGDELIIHGGMCSMNDRRSYGDLASTSSSSSSYSSPSSSYVTYTATPKWQALSDVWVFDLVNLRWKERYMFPQLARSYHSLVGWGNGAVAAFGGYQQDDNIGGETIAFVFKDLLVSRPNETHWMKLQPPADPIPRAWHAIQNYDAPQYGISNRLEHSAVLDRYGSMFVWGGRFQTVRQITGMWRLDVFTEDAKLKFDVAVPDGIEAYEAELESMRIFIAVLMFTSFAMSSLFGMTRRQGEGGVANSSFSSRRGLARDVIDSLPLKRYETHRAVTEDGDFVVDVSLGREDSREDGRSGLEDADCCPICLVEYEEGCEIRVLPCGHFFDRECIETWLESHTNCPTCRRSISNTPLPRREDSTSDDDDDDDDGDDNDSAEDDAVDNDSRFALPSPLRYFARGAMSRVFDSTGRSDGRWFGPLDSHPSDNSADETAEDELDTDVDVSIREEPRFGGIRRFFRARRARMPIPREDEARESIELV